MSTTTEVLAHWSTLIENFQYSTQDFYKIVTQAVEKRQIPNATVDLISMKESHFLSGKRDYLRIRCKNEFYFAVCGAPFGSGFFVSYWLLQPPEGCLVGLLSLFPVVSAFAKALVIPWTYYRIDTATMFRTAAHSAVMEAVDYITTTSNIKALPEADRKPVLREFFG